MTIDELLQQLMKIKEIYPDSGNFKLVIYNSDLCDFEDLARLVKVDNEIRLTSIED